jgi:formate dehydrogenase maturation protein FdhE
MLIVLGNNAIQIAISEAQRIQFAERFREHKSALTFRDITIDWKIVHSNCRVLTDLVEENFPEENLKELNSISGDEGLFIAASQEWFENTSLSLKNYGTIIASVLHGALYPVLTAYADKLMPLVPQDSWRQRFCPVCGGIPDFCFLDKEQGARWLLCSRCDAIWLFHRMVCPFCGNEEQNSLGYFATENSRYRLYTCNKCLHYIKCIDFRCVEAEVLLPLERLLTVDMDKQARELNYISS